MTDSRSFEYVARKLAHMKRIGLACGIGRNGGAAPQWLIDKQRADIERERAAGNGLSRRYVPANFGQLA
jgi:hypothetical protein